MSLEHLLGDARVAEVLEPGQESTLPRDPPPEPSVVDALRECGPSRDLLGLLSHLSTAAAKEGKKGDAQALLLLALVVKRSLCAA